MKFDFDKALLPPVYKRNNADCYLDPIRKRLVYVTPEETVRQKVIYYLLNELNVPSEMIAVEEHLSHFGVKSNKRADILILGLDKDKNLILLIEDNMLIDKLVLEENYMFIHGNMSDYPNARHYKDDIYTKYLGVSRQMVYNYLVLDK